MISMKKKIKVKAFAKINIALAVYGCENGMHPIDSIVTNVDIFDTITLQAREDKDIVICYDNTTTPKGDTTKKMAKLLQKTYDTRGLNINIIKRIPMSAGLGGSSADAAGIARGMSQLFELGVIPNDLLLKIGSDVPYMYIGGAKRIRGIGEQIENITLPKLYYALIVPPTGTNTAEAYNLFDKVGGEQPNIDEILQRMGTSLPYDTTNALQRAAEMLNPNIKSALSLLKNAGFTKTVMSGSGSCVIGMETDKAIYDALTKKLQQSLPTNYKLYKS